MRHHLLALLVAYSLTAVADDSWIPFPYDQAAYDYSGDKLREAWPRLTRGFGPDYPYPDAKWVSSMAIRHPNAANVGFNGKPQEAQAYATQLQEVWRLVFRGDFAQAKEQGLKLGIGGQVPAMFAQVVYAMFLAPNQAEKHRLLEEAIRYTDKADDLVQSDVAAQLGRTYAKARLGEDLPVPVVIKRGYTQQIPEELDTLLTQQPRQPFALALYGGYEAGVIRRVGRLVGKLTYGVSAEKMERYFAQAFKTNDDLPIGHYEYANALLYVYGEKKENKALEHLKKAVSIQPINAVEALEVAQARELLRQWARKVALN